MPNENENVYPAHRRELSNCFRCTFHADSPVLGKMKLISDGTTIMPLPQLEGAFTLRET
jgi:hypothetical protein